MTRMSAYMTIFTLVVAAAMPAFAQQQVERKGVTSTVKLEQVVSGYLKEINGKVIAHPA